MVDERRSYLFANSGESISTLVLFEPEAAKQVPSCRENLLQCDAAAERLALASRLKREDGILLGGNRRAVARRRLEAPVIECRQALGIDVGTEALQHSLADNLAACVDGDFDNLVARIVGKLPGVDNR